MEIENNYNKKRIFINGLSSLIQVGITTLTYFFLYKYILKDLGADQLGLWSLVLATTSIVGIGSFGVSGSAVKFVAGYTAKKDFEKVNEVIYTGVLITTVFISVFSIISYFIISYLLKSLVSPTVLITARILLPYAFISLIANTIGYIFLSAIDGLQLIFIKNILLCFFSIVFLVLVFVLVPNFKIVGVAYAQVIQSVGTLVGGIILVIWKIKGFNIFRWKFSKLIFKELFGYGMKIQIMSIAAMLFDPITKYFLTRFGGLGIVGIYEMANKLVIQLRSLIISASQVMVPAIAGLIDVGDASIKKIYKEMFEVISFSSIVLIVYIMAFARYISIIWIGKIQYDFVITLFIVCVGWLFNLFSSPAFLINLATGRLKWNLISQFSIGILNCIFCYVFGIFFGKYYIIIGASLSLALSALMLIIFFNKQYKIGFFELFDKHSILLIIGSILIVVFNNYLYDWISNTLSLYFSLGLSFTLVTIFLSVFFISHPIKVKALRMVKLNVSR